MKSKLNLFSTFYFLLLALSMIPLFLLIQASMHNYTLFFEWTLFSPNSLQFTVILIIDWLSMSFLLTVLLISSSIMKFSNYYMASETHIFRFITILSLFIASMCALILSPNMISMLLGWDGLGLTSYALVIFYQNESSMNAGAITILSNRIGDVSILISIALTSYQASWNFPMYSNMAVLPLFFIFLAACTKSAQLPFSAWLPAAMAAPTPVSSLVHSSTLVTAGVYLLIRFNFLIFQSPTIMKMLLMTATTTTFMASLSANLEMDMKKIIALSTLSQLGLMMLSLAMKAPELAFFHLITHAMFKSSLFMCAGFIIHNTKSSQDSRFMTHTTLTSPSMITMFTLTNMALSGFPFLAAFYSKDLIFEASNNITPHIMAITLATLSSALTISYSFRLMFNSMSSNSLTNPLTNMSDITKITSISLYPLFLSTLFISYLYLSASNFLMNPTPLLTYQKFLLILLSSSALFLMILMNTFKSLNISLAPLTLLNPMVLMWYLPIISSKKISTFFFKKSLINFKAMEQGWLELYGPSSLTKTLSISFNYTQSSQNNIITKLLMSFMFLLTISLMFFYN